MGLELTDSQIAHLKFMRDFPNAEKIASGYIEQDALNNTDYQEPPPPAHTHEVKSFVATPHTEQGLLQKVRSWLRGDSDPNVPLVYKGVNGLRYILSITSNAYEDRENETITSAALKAYEESCFPGADLYHNDNSYLWWHDDDVPMGRIAAVNYSEPFLIELIEEIADDPVSKVLFDFAEKNGHKAGASHRFGYLEEDRLPNGDYLHIYKQESTFLPDRSLAANGMTYAGVVGTMANPQSDAWLDKIFKEATGIESVSSILHDKSRDHAQKLAEIKGLMHKAIKPPIPPLEETAPVTDDVIEDEIVEEDVKGDMPIPAYMGVVNQILGLVMDLVDSQTGGMETQAAFAKSLKALEDTIEEKQVAEKSYTQSLEDKIKALETRIEIAEKRLSLQGKSVTQVKGDTPAEVIAAVVSQVEKSRIEGDLEDVPGFGKLKAAPKYD